MMISVMYMYMYMYMYMPKLFNQNSLRCVDVHV